MPPLIGGEKETETENEEKRKRENMQKKRKRNGRDGKSRVLRSRSVAWAAVTDLQELKDRVSRYKKRGRRRKKRGLLFLRENEGCARAKEWRGGGKEKTVAVKCC